MTYDKQLFNDLDNRILPMSILELFQFEYQKSLSYL